ncbi:MAG: LysR family transcriptional regulator, partial [Lachnospiraceae bacterium]|nr:LysR family transcriptional regulator [Lachnospiraceae bacterium]
MTLLQMQYFMEVCRCGSTLKAAQAANVSQSTISMAIRALEKELSIPLFDRSSKGLAPNAAGSFFLDQCSEILKKTERLAEEMKQFLSISRPLRLGIPVVLNEFYWLD